MNRKTEQCCCSQDDSWQDTAPVVGVCCLYEKSAKPAVVANISRPVRQLLYYLYSNERYGWRMEALGGQ